MMGGVHTLCVARRLAVTILLLTKGAPSQLVRSAVILLSNLKSIAHLCILTLARSYCYGRSSTTIPAFRSHP